MTDFKQDSWDESQDQTEGEIPIILASPASKASVLEALIIYPVSSGVTALFERRDIYALALSSPAIFYALNIADPISWRSMILFLAVFGSATGPACGGCRIIFQHRVRVNRRVNIWMSKHV